MAQSAANLVEHVWFVNHSSASLPNVPLRQFVVTFPFELRARLAYDGKLLSAITRIAIDSILGSYKRRMRDGQAINGQSGAVSVVLLPFLGVMVQRVSSDLRLNPHLPAIVIDGVFVADNDPVVSHVSTTLINAHDARAREALARYIRRPPLAQERLHLLPDNLVRIELKRAFRDGTIAIDLDPLSLLCRLAAAVPSPGFHLVHYAGVLGAASKLRPWLGLVTLARSCKPVVCAVGEQRPRSVGRWHHHQQLDAGNQ